jgi:hypothetical protein
MNKKTAFFVVAKLYAKVAYARVNNGINVLLVASVLLEVNV